MSWRNTLLTFAVLGAAFGIGWLVRPGPDVQYVSPQEGEAFCKPVCGKHPAFYNWKTKRCICDVTHEYVEMEFTGGSK